MNGIVHPLEIWLRRRVEDVVDVAPITECGSPASSLTETQHRIIQDHRSQHIVIPTHLALNRYVLTHTYTHAELN